MPNGGREGRWLSLGLAEHGSAVAAHESVAEHGCALPPQLYERINTGSWGGSDEQLAQQLVEAYEGAHAHTATFHVDEATGKGPAHESGAVGVGMLLRQGRAILSWCGDCRAILGELRSAWPCQACVPVH